MKREGFDICPWCGEVILPGEDQSPATLNGKPVHYECGFRMVCGSANHILRQCSCYGGEETHEDQPHMSRREAARWALTVAKWVQELRVVMERAKKRPAQGGPGGGGSSGD